MQPPCNSAPVAGRRPDARWATSPRAAPSFVAAPRAHLSKDFSARRRPALPPAHTATDPLGGRQHLRGVSGGDDLRRADHITEATNCDAPLRRRAEVRCSNQARRPATDALQAQFACVTTSPASHGPTKLRRSPTAAAARPQDASRQSKSLFIAFYLPPSPPPRLRPPRGASPKRREHAHVTNDHSKLQKGPQPKRLEPDRRRVRRMMSRCAGDSPTPRARRRRRRPPVSARRRAPPRRFSARGHRPAAAMHKVDDASGSAATSSRRARFGSAPSTSPPPVRSTSESLSSG